MDEPQFFQEGECFSYVLLRNLFATFSFKLNTTLNVNCLCCFSPTQFINSFTTRTIPQPLERFVAKDSYLCIRPGNPTSFTHLIS